MKTRYLTIFAPMLLCAVSLVACSAGLISSRTTSPDRGVLVDRETRIPADAEKVSTGTDARPPHIHSTEFETPVPVPGQVNTAGAEDSPFITPDGNTLYFFFTPDVNIPAEKQLLDGVTGIYRSEKVNGAWAEAERIILQDAGGLALDGCEFVLGDTMWFCSAREGYDGIHWFTADRVDGTWQNWQMAGVNPEYQVGELHISGDGNELYFHSEKPGRRSRKDIIFSL